MELTEAGQLPYGAQICDIGVTQLFGAALREGAASMLAYYARRAPSHLRAANNDTVFLDDIKDGMFLGDLLERAGFTYVALDIFDAPRTILFDLNRHAPGPALKGRFDLVMNLGTTEHVINQLNAFQVVHDLCAKRGVMYHDLPSDGYFSHGFFRYDELFFRNLAGSNEYSLIRQLFSVGRAVSLPAGFEGSDTVSDAAHDIGIETVLRKQYDHPFQIPMEQTTSLTTENLAADAIDNEYVVDTSCVDAKNYVKPAPGIIVRTYKSARKWGGRLKESCIGQKGSV
ncbi:hypothetical protein KAJ83_01370 [Marivibrio halodurans]|uniref:Methyltransferase domain-containing protein n=1 Tax=Marivibrio halodurans TaxID=2039722 RepID=A0A8J7V1A6_9PROT|nr:methyltransferase domain-containing protein [Marivibrio halodurans]MBP5855642.1 hypothetical protein [Marivibrio halodurans]